MGGWWIAFCLGVIFMYTKFLGMSSLCHQWETGQAFDWKASRGVAFITFGPRWRQERLSWWGCRPGGHRSGEGWMCSARPGASGAGAGLRANTAAASLRSALGEGPWSKPAGLASGIGPSQTWPARIWALGYIFPAIWGKVFFWRMFFFFFWNYKAVSSQRNKKCCCWGELRWCCLQWALGWNLRPHLTQKGGGKSTSVMEIEDSETTRPTKRAPSFPCQQQPKYTTWLAPNAFWWAFDKGEVLEYQQCTPNNSSMFNKKPLQTMCLHWEIKPALNNVSLQTEEQRSVHPLHPSFDPS